MATLFSTKLRLRWSGSYIIQVVHHHDAIDGRALRTVIYLKLITGT